MLIPMKKEKPWRTRSSCSRSKNIYGGWKSWNFGGWRPSRKTMRWVRQVGTMKPLLKTKRARWMMTMMILNMMFTFHHQTFGRRWLRKISIFSEIFLKSRNNQLAKATKPSTAAWNRKTSSSSKNGLPPKKIRSINTAFSKRRRAAKRKTFSKKQRTAPAATSSSTRTQTWRKKRRPIKTESNSYWHNNKMLRSFVKWRLILLKMILRT